MRIAIGADHGGYPLNERVIEELRSAGHELTDFGTHDGSIPDDYPDYALKVGEAVQAGKADIGILICGSGVGAAREEPAAGGAAPGLSELSSEKITGKNNRYRKK